MAEEIKKSNQPQEENQPEPENVDNSLPYEPPLLRKHGKVNDATKTVFYPGALDSFFGPNFADFS